MVVCCVKGCNNKSLFTKGISYFSIPAVVKHQGSRTMELSAKRREAWISKINRKNWAPNTNSFVCQCHFTSGKPSALYAETHPDWAPSLRLGYKSSVPDESRYDRLQQRNAIKRPADQDGEIRKRTRGEHQEEENLSTAEAGNEDQLQNDEQVDDQNEDTDGLERSELLLLKSQHAELTSELATLHSEIAVLRSNNATLKAENSMLKKEVEELRKSKSANFTEEFLKEKENESILKFYTGFPEWITFSAFIDLLKPSLSGHHYKLPILTLIFMFLMKLRLNLFDEDIAHRFGVHRSTVSRNFHRILNIAVAKSSFLIKWPERDMLRLTMPVSFRRFLKKCCIIIDCTEIFMERPSDLLARAQVWSNYKHHSTVKFLIGITPQGSISFVSKCAGGRMSDKEITESCGLMDLLLPGDVVLADRGFTCNEKARMVLAEVKTPPFTKGKKQLEKQEVDWSRELSIVRIHVERVIGVLKQKYTILQGTLPISLINDNDDDNETTIDKIVRVCCALINMCPPVVPIE